MTTPLAVLTPRLGTLSETFVARHVRDVLPGGTAAVVRRPTSRPAWAFDGPVVELTSERGAPLASATTRLAWAAGRRARREPRPVGMELPWRPSRRTVATLIGTLTDYDVEAVLAEYLHPWTPVVAPLERAGIRVVAHAHGRDVSAYLRDRRWRNEYLRYRDASAVVTVSELTRSRLAACGLDAERIHVVPCGTDVPGEPPTRPGGDEFEVVAVGRMVPKKAPLTVLRAFTVASRREPALRLTMFGGGPLLDDCRQYVSDHDLEHAVSLPGAAPSATVTAALRSAHAFVAHSVVDPVTGDEEGLPVAVLEAMAAALPVVATRHAGIPEAVDHGTTGVLVDEHDERALAAALVELAGDRARAEGMGRAGWAVARDRFTWERERAQLLDLLGLTSPAPVPIGPFEEGGHGRS